MVGWHSDSVMSLGRLGEMVEGREAWNAAVHGGSKSQPRLRDGTTKRKKSSEGCEGRELGEGVLQQRGSIAVKLHARTTSWNQGENQCKGLPDRGCDRPSRVTASLGDPAGRVSGELTQTPLSSLPLISPGRSADQHRKAACGQGRWAGQDWTQGPPSS